MIDQKTVLKAYLMAKEVLVNKEMQRLDAIAKSLDSVLAKTLVYLNALKERKLLDEKRLKVIPLNARVKKALETLARYEKEMDHDHLVQIIKDELAFEVLKATVDYDSHLNDLSYKEGIKRAEWANMVKTELRDLLK